MTSQALPAFAAVGHPNKGKSSIVATLAEDAGVAVSPVPGTTTTSRPFTFVLDGEPLYRLLDTPGFQRPRQVLAWLQERADSASDRPAAVAAFVAAHRSDPRFHDECELLTPLLEGAGILYVVDGSRPYGPEYEAEMEILRWTGQPRMALVNPITDGDHVAEWRRALDQYFAIVRVFNAVHATFEQRVDLLRAFGELREEWRPSLQRAAEHLRQARGQRRQQAAAIIASLLADCLGHVETDQLADRTASNGDKLRLQDRLQAWVRQREQRAWADLQAVYQHSDLAVHADSELLATDVFARESWEVFGLSRQQLLTAGALAGATTGALADAAVGGLSLFAGTLIGGTLGAAGAWFGADNLAKVRVLDTPLGGKVLRVGPVKDPQFPWVLLGRALLHHRLVAERNHARREAMALAAADSAHLAGTLPEAQRRQLAKLFGQLATSDPDPAAQDALAQAVEASMAGADPVSSAP